MALLIGILGNMLPVPIIYLFARKILEWGKDKRVIGDFFTWCLNKGERGGKKCDGFDFGNSPSTVSGERLKGNIAIHTTSAGTQGIVNALGAEEIITGSLVNARAIAEYIKAKNPQEVSLVAMGTGGTRPNPEDELCALYIKSLLENAPLPDMAQRVADLRQHGGEHFFDPQRQDVFPEEDFHFCVQYDRFPFVIRVERDELGFITRKIPVLQ